MDLISMQKKIKEFVEKNNLDSSIESRTLDLVSEVGEVAKEVLKSTSYGKKPFNISAEMELEIGDVFFSLTTLANQLNIDIEKALDMVLSKYQKRLTHGSAGSEVEE